MNKLFIVGNLTRDPEVRITHDGKTVCIFTIAVTRRHGKEGAEYFRVSAWKALGESCASFLAKGKKVAVTGSVSLNSYESNGQTRANMEVVADEVEFLSPKASQNEVNAENAVIKNGYVEVDSNPLPF